MIASISEFSFIAFFIRLSASHSNNKNVFSFKITFPLHMNRYVDVYFNGMNYLLNAWLNSYKGQIFDDNGKRLLNENAF